MIVTIFSFLNPWAWKLTQQPIFTGQAPGEEPNTLYGIRNVAVLFAFIVLFIGLIPTFVCRERYYSKAQKQKKEPLFKSLKLTFRSKPFLLMLLIILTMNLEGLVMGMGGYITLYHVFNGDKIFAATYTGISGTMGAILGLFSIPLFGALAKRFGKERSLLLVTLGHILMALSILAFYNPSFLKLLAAFFENFIQTFLSPLGAQVKLDYRWFAMIPGIFNGLL
ncbi:MAG: MFS transporter, partial [Chthoniobacterales bacterium]|nr:MFS transporter [Chthoniobacterales bacterium]